MKIRGIRQKKKKVCQGGGNSEDWGSYHKTDRRWETTSTPQVGNGEEPIFQKGHREGKSRERTEGELGGEGEAYSSKKKTGWGKGCGLPSEIEGRETVLITGKKDKGKPESLPGGLKKRKNDRNGSLIGQKESF